jgi:hypothetical protein
MSRKQFIAKKIIGMLREAKVALSQGMKGDIKAGDFTHWMSVT